jgi:hypothetical protein
VAFDRGLAAPAGDLGRSLAELGNELLHQVATVPERVRVSLDLR